MPEALTVLAVFAVCVAVYVGAMLKSRDSSRVDPREEQRRREEQQRWLQGRLETARREKWDAAMVSRIDGELQAVTKELTRSAP